MPHLLVGLMLITLTFPLLNAQEVTDNEEKLSQLVDEAIGIFEEKQTSGRPIPAGVIRNAKAIGIIEVTKGGLGVAASRGSGVIVARTLQGWSAPLAFYQGGGSVGFQVGVNVKKYLYIFNNEASLRPFTGDGKGELKAGAEATAGPDTYSQEAVAGVPIANIYIYSLSEGAFAGAAVGGQTFGAEKDINRKAYGTSNRDDILGGKIAAPAYAQVLYQALNRAAGGAVKAPEPLPPSSKK